MSKDFYICKWWGIRRMEDWMIITIFFGALALSVLLIVMTLSSLPQLGDERKKLIKMKAQSYAFAFVIGSVFIQMVEMIYINGWTEGSYEGMNPFTFLVTTSLMYLFTLLFFKRKYGG